MKKVVYSIKKVRNPDEKLSGLGFINDEGTLLPYLASETFYIRIIAYFNLKINNFWRTFPHKYKMFSLVYPQISNILLFFD